MSTPANPRPRRSVWKYVWRTVLVIVAVLLLIIGGLAWYATTPDFANRVRKYVIATLEQSTGGKVQLQAFHWRLLHLAFEVDNLTIHGLEGPREAPYVHLDRLYGRAKIVSFFQPKIDLNYLEIDRPAIHLIIYPDGSTNAPKPKTVRSGKPLKDTIFDLQIGRTELKNGVALLNQRAIPFNLAANDLGAIVKYSAPRDHYLGTLHAADIVAQRGKRPAVHSVLDLSADMGRNSLDVSSLKLKTGDSLLTASASVNNFADPQWKLSALGNIDLREVEALAAVPGIERGVVDLQLKGQGTGTVFSVDGQSKLIGVAYNTAAIHLSGVSAEAALRATQDELAITGIRARLASGGSIDGDIHILHWHQASAATGAKIPLEQGSIRARVQGVTLRSVLAMVAPPKFKDIGFDTSAGGTLNVDWTGSMSNMTAAAKMTLTPPAVLPRGELPLSGVVDAAYSNRSGTVQIRQLQAQTPATHVQVTGALGVYPVGRKSALQVDLTTTNLGEFDRTLAALGVSSRKTSQTLPVALRGPAEFHGAVSGTLAAPDVKGHLSANNFDITLSQPASGIAPTTIYWDSFDAQAEYSPALISIQQATLTRGKTVIHASGQLHAHRISSRRSAFDSRSAINADVRVQNARLADLTAIAGKNIPLAGTLNLEVHAGGQVGNLSGGGHVAVQGGEAYGEPYHSLNADLQFAGHEVGATNLVLLQDGGQVRGDGGYNLASKQFHFDAQGGGFDLTHFHRLENARYPVAGKLAFKAQGSGTIKAPVLHASLHLTQFSIANQARGYVDAEAHTQGNQLLLNAHADLNSAQLQIASQTALSGEYQTQAHLTIAKLDLQPYLEMFNVQGVKAHSSISGKLNVDGPLRQPRKMSGDAELSQLSLSLAGVPLKSDGALRATLRNGILKLDPLHITGEDTDLRAHGSVGVFDTPRMLDVHANGSVNMKLAQSINSNISSSGHVNFNLDASGTMKQPILGGQVKFNDVNFGLQTFPNGISKMNGTLQFDQGRLEVKNLTAYTGGGLLTMGGFVTYQQGIYGDLTVSGKDVRIRYPTGVSTVVNTKLRLQGTTSNLLLSGNVLITRFAISQNLDFASFTSVGGGVTPPPNPNAFTNHIRLDVHVTSAPELDVQNSFARLAGDVNLHVRGTVATPSVLGHVTITEGSATFAGTKYELQHGDIYFTNPVRIQPVIDLDATAHVENYEITIGLHGTPDKLTPTFRSEPPLSEQDIFSLIAMGRTQEEQAIYSQEQSQAGVNSTADTLLGGALNATLSSRIQKLFGGGSVKIDPTFVSGLGNATARITVQEQVSKNATLTYATNVNSTAEQLIKGELHITHNLSVVAVRDEVGVFSLIFQLHRRYR